MTQHETITIIKRIRNLYMAQSRQFSDSDWQTMINTWQDQFKDESFENVNKALSMYIERGKQFMPSVPDIINELTNLDEPETKKLFEVLKKECAIVATGETHITLDDLGGLRKDPTSPKGWRFDVAEAHETTRYTQADFANLPMEIQIYADDIEGLKALNAEIASNPNLAYRRFRERLPYVKQEIKDGAGHRRKGQGTFDVFKALDERRANGNQ